MSIQVLEVKLPEMSMAEFLESAPPSTRATIPDLFVNQVFLGSYQWVANTPDIQLHCNSTICGGLRFFAGERYVLSSSENFFLTYICRNCKQTSKTFAISTGIKDVASAAGTALKVGEDPPFGPPIPSRVISLVGSDRENFLKGRRSENHGLGIGAFAYYRRVVEDQKGKLIEEIAKVAKRLGVDANTLGRFERAKNETQFSKAVNDIKDAIPQSLLIDGHNPLTLLHGALSEGIHAQADEECLEIATSIRVILTELAERISQALKDEAELKNAVSRLLKPRPKP